MFQHLRARTTLNLKSIINKTRKGAIQFGILVVLLQNELRQAPCDSGNGGRERHCNFRPASLGFKSILLSKHPPQLINVGGI